MYRKYSFVLLFALMLFPGLFSQDENRSPFNAGADIFSSYIWRGTKCGSGPAIQPRLEFNSGFFTAGAWGSFDFSGYQETDLYVSFSLPAGFSAGINDYYYPDMDFFDLSDTTGSHAFEINLGFTVKSLELNAGYVINRSGIIGSKGGDKYIEIRYSFDSFSLFVGAGDGWHTLNTTDGKDRFAICNIGLGTKRTIKVTDCFNIPVTGQLIFNPDLKHMYVVAGFTF